MAAEEEGIKELIFIHIPGIPEALTMSWLVMAVIVFIAFMGSIAMKLAPKGFQNFLEFSIEWINTKIADFMGEAGKPFFPLFAMLFSFIFISNLIGLVPGLKSPTSNLSINLSLALIIFLATHFFGIMKKGVKNYFRHFIEPKGGPLLLYYLFLVPLFILIHTVGELIRPISLTLRLFFNILAKEILLSVLAFLFTVFIVLYIPPAKIFGIPVSGIIKDGLIALPVILRPGIILLGAFVSFVQALVFTVLSMIYIGSAIEEHEH
ncbi:MAG: ATP synthase F0 subunit A [Candidatus Firestonebacteria bacterium RIFOXYC2_FULL_39_67]|nr:MAG: ATP synthase F0 subunit A [Candidatus Firestonebacteria bacterium RIFOXYD2_FULL_39_29]OGF52972.1 MAG: ATP synthase F0 subunit A [Candidatus Firestonebacteria bacterium RifOxyC12_full_39_7]OGF55524.1 MAG: ATP synthase F0 subunit A [Candidatus Firestonebacteria bacterium RIFOXYC2_FULL_39_67]